ncbi:MAG: hypothetical protein SGJ23_14625 [Alphaproteobacteria bacterium]|nr:hypothetical protein [Alphaproteobacteria bacterium]
MKTKFAIAAIAALCISTGAFAAGKTYVTAKLASPVSEKSQVIANSVVWTCEGDTCTAQFSRAVTTRVCGELAKEVGRVTSIGDLSAEDLARCNLRAAAPEATVFARN